jgi:hypothetical protein
MRMTTRLLGISLLLLGLIWLHQHSLQLHAYVEAPMSLGSVIQQSSNVLVMTVTAVDKEKNLIIFKKVKDLKGNHPQEIIKHNIGRGGLRPGEWKDMMDWAEVGKTAIFFHNGSASETFIGSTWYQAYPRGDWWDMSHAEPFLLRSYAGKIDKLPQAVLDLLAGKEIIIPCMLDGNKEELHQKKAKVQRLKASIKLLDYNPKRDFVGWGGEDIRRVNGMPGFTQLAMLGRLDREARGVSPCDFDNDGKVDFVLFGASKCVLVHNQGDTFTELSLPGIQGARSASWSDINQDGKPDLLIGTLDGPNLLINLGNGIFRNDRDAFPLESGYDLRTCGWFDYDQDGKPDVLLSNGFHGLKLYRNRTDANSLASTKPLVFSKWHLIGPFPNENNQGLTKAFPPETEIDFKKTYPGKGNQKAGWVEKEFADGQVHSLALFPAIGNSEAVVYLQREITAAVPTELPISLGSDDGLAVFLNGERLLMENISRAASPDQHLLKLALKPGKNSLLLKVSQGNGEWAFYYKNGEPKVKNSGWFEDATQQAGLDQIQGRIESLLIADLNQDGFTDFLAVDSLPKVYLNQQGRFQGKDGSVPLPNQSAMELIDYDQDGHLDLLAVQENQLIILRNDGIGNFSSVNHQSKLHGSPLVGVTSISAGDINHDGKIDLIFGCLRGPNRYFANQGSEQFQDQTASIGLNQKVWNSRAISLVDLNQDGKLDWVLANEGQESAILFGAASADSKHVVLQVPIPDPTNVLGTRIRLKTRNEASKQQISITGILRNGGQPLPMGRFVVLPDQYQIEALMPNGKMQLQTIDLQSNFSTLKWNEKK